MGDCGFGQILQSYSHIRLAEIVEDDMGVKEKKWNRGRQRRRL